MDSFDTSIASVRANVKMQKRLEPSIGNIAGYVINFYNKIYHPHDGHIGVVKSSIFKYKDSNNATVNAYIEDDGTGGLCLYTNDSGVKVKIQTIGSIDYETGTLTLVSFSPVQDESSFVIKFTATPDSSDITSSRNILITMDSSDSDALNVNVIKESNDSTIGTTNTDAVVKSIVTSTDTSVPIVTGNTRTTDDTTSDSSSSSSNNNANGSDSGGGGSY